MENLIGQELPSHPMRYFIVVGPQLIFSFTFCAKLNSSIMFYLSLLACFLRCLICTAAQMWKITSFHFYLFAFTSASNKSQGLDKSDIWRTTNWQKMINLNTGHLPKHSPVTSGWNPLSAPVTKFDKGAELGIWGHLRDIWPFPRLQFNPSSTPLSSFREIQRWISSAGWGRFSFLVEFPRLLGERVNRPTSYLPLQMKRSSWWQLVTQVLLSNLVVS